MPQISSTPWTVLLHMLNLLEKYDMTERTGVHMHRAVEILKFGFAARYAVISVLAGAMASDLPRTKICDPDFHNNTARMNEISTKAFAEAVHRNLTDVG